MADLDAHVRLSARADPSLRRGFSDAETSVSKLDRRLDGLKIPPPLAGQTRAAGGRFRSLGDSAGLAGRRVRATTGEFRRLNREIGRTDRGAAGLRTRLGGLGGASGLGAAGLLAGVGGIFAARRQIQKALDQSAAEIRLRTVVVTEGDRGEAAARLRKDAQELARSREAALATESELVEAFYQSSSAGLAEQLARDAGVVSHRVARVTSGNIEQVTATVARSLNLFGEGIAGPVERRAEVIGDILAAVQQAEQISNFDALGAGLEKASGTALAAGLRFADLAAILGRLNSLGILGPEAGTALSVLLAELPRGAGKLEFDIVRADDGALDLLQTLRNIQQVIAGLDPDEAILRLQKGFGQEAVRTISLLTSNIDTIQPALDRTSEGIGRVRRDYNELVDDVSGKSEIAKQAIGDVADSFAGVLLPALGSTAGPLAEAANRIAGIADRSPLAADGIKGLAAGLATLGVVAAGIKIGAGLAALLGAGPAAAIAGGVAGGVVLGGALGRVYEPRRAAQVAEFERLARETAAALRVGASSGRAQLSPHAALPRVQEDADPFAPVVPGGGAESSLGVLGARRGELPETATGRWGALIIEDGAIRISGASPRETAEEVIRRLEARARSRSSAAEFDER